MRVEKESTIETIKAHEPELRNFARNVVELYDRDRDGDDYWTSYSFGDGSFADVNVWIDEQGKHEWLVVTAYPVAIDGSIITNQYRQLYKESLKANYTTTKGNFK